MPGEVRANALFVRAKRSMREVGGRDGLVLGGTKLTEPLRSAELAESVGRAGNLITQG